MNSSPSGLGRRDRHPLRTSRIASVATLTVALVAGSVAIGAGSATAAPLQINNATFEWELSDEANTGAYNGQCNYMSGGISDGSESTFRAAEGNATVMKLNNNGQYEPISSYANRCRDKDGVNVTAGGTRRLGQKVVYKNGTGSVNPVTGEATIQWTGSFSSNYYGSLIPFWFIDPKLTVDANGNGTITATMGGYSSSMDNPDVRELVDPVAGVVIAEMKNVDSKNLSGFVATPVYNYVTYTRGEAPQVTFYDPWGAWPDSFMSFMELLNLEGYWYSTGGMADRRKPPVPVTIAFGEGAAPTTTTTTTAAPGVSTTTTTAAPGVSTTTTPVTTTTSATPSTTTIPGSTGGVRIGVDIPSTLDNSTGNGGNGNGNGNGNGEDNDGDGLPDDVFRWTIDAGQSGVTLNPVIGSTGQLRFAGSLSGITVVDTRNGSPSWSLSGQVSDFGAGLSGRYLGWTPKVLTAGGGAIPGSAVPSGSVAGNGLSAPAQLASAPAGHPKGSVTVGADLDLIVPSSTPAGYYTATLTLTALG